MVEVVKTRGSANAGRTMGTDALGGGSGADVGRFAQRASAHSRMSYKTGALALLQSTTRHPRSAIYVGRIVELTCPCGTGRR